MWLLVRLLLGRSLVITSPLSSEQARARLAARVEPLRASLLAPRGPRACRRDPGVAGALEGRQVRLLFQRGEELSWSAPVLAGRLVPRRDGTAEEGASFEGFLRLRQPLRLVLVVAGAAIAQAAWKSIGVLAGSDAGDVLALCALGALCALALAAFGRLVGERAWGEARQLEEFVRVALRTDKPSPTQAEARPAADDAVRKSSASKPIGEKQSA